MRNPRNIGRVPHVARASSSFYFLLAGATGPILRIWPSRRLMKRIAFYPAGRGDRLRETYANTVAGMVGAALVAFDCWMYRLSVLFGHSLTSVVGRECTSARLGKASGPTSPMSSARHLDIGPDRPALPRDVVAALKQHLAATGSPNQVTR